MTTEEYKERVCDHCFERILDGKTYVEGEGSVPARYLILGEAPGKTGDKEGRPFIGRSGKLLRNVLRDIGLDSKDYYITNSVRTRPPGNRNPYMRELRSCRGVCLRRTIEWVQPECIICVGSSPWKQLTDDSRVAITKERRKVLELCGICISFETLEKDLELYDKDEQDQWNESVLACTIPSIGTKNQEIKAVVTFHPAAVLRNPYYEPYFKADLESYIRDESWNREEFEVDYEVVQ